MIISFIWPTSSQYAGGVAALFEMANAQARRGNEVHFIHGPANPHRIDHLDELPAFRFEPEIRHRIVDTLDPSVLPTSDVVFHEDAPAQLGLPAVIVQGYRMVPSAWEQGAYRARAPKVCIANWLVDVGLDLGVPADQLWHVPYGLDHKLFAPTVAFDARPFDVAMLRHTHNQKGWRVGLRALQELRLRRPGIRIVVFGIEVPDEPLPDGTVFISSPNHRQLADDVYNQTKVFVQPSFHEGFGFTAVEAMACGAALVSTNNGGSRDYALHGETAWVVEPGDAAGLADGVDQLLGDPAERIRLASIGEQYVRRFDWDLSAEVLERHLQGYLADPARYQAPPAERDLPPVGS